MATATASPSSIRPAQSASSALSATAVPPLCRSVWLSRAQVTLAPRYQAAAGECSLLTCLNQYTAIDQLAGNSKFGCVSCTELRNRQLSITNIRENEETVYSNARKQLLLYCPPPVLTIHLKRFEVRNLELHKVSRHVQFGERLDLGSFCSSASQDLPQMQPDQRRVLYSLFGVIEHSGSLTNGHYTAYVRVRRRHKFTASSAILTSLVTDAFGVACERARRRAEKTERAQRQAAPGPENVATTAETAEKSGAETAINEQPQPTPELEGEPGPEPGHWFRVSDTRVTVTTLDQILKAQAYLLFYERVE